MLVGQWAQRRAGQQPAAGQHRQLAATAADDPTGHADMLAEIDVGLPRREPILVDAVAADHGLQLRATFLDGGETELVPVRDSTTRPVRLTTSSLSVSVSVSKCPYRERISPKAGRTRGGQRVRRWPAGQQPVTLLAARPYLSGKSGFAAEPEGAGGLPPFYAMAGLGAPERASFPHAQALCADLLVGSGGLEIGGHHHAGRRAVRGGAAGPGAGTGHRAVRVALFHRGLAVGPRVNVTRGRRRASPAKAPRHASRCSRYTGARARRGSRCTGGGSPPLRAHH